MIFRNHNKLICNISDYYQCWKQSIFLYDAFYFSGFTDEEKAQKNSVYFCNIINVFTVTFDQFNASLMTNACFSEQHIRIFQLWVMSSVSVFVLTCDSCATPRCVSVCWAESLRFLDSWRAAGTSAGPWCRNLVRLQPNWGTQQEIDWNISRDTVLALHVLLRDSGLLWGLMISQLL